MNAPADAPDSVNTSLNANLQAALDRARTPLDEAVRAQLDADVEPLVHFTRPEQAAARHPIALCGLAVRAGEPTYTTDPDAASCAVCRRFVAEMDAALVAKVRAEHAEAAQSVLVAKLAAFRKLGAISETLPPFRSTNLEEVRAMRRRVLEAETALAACEAAILEEQGVRPPGRASLRPMPALGALPRVAAYAAAQVLTLVAFGGRADDSRCRHADEALQGLRAYGPEFGRIADELEFWHSETA